MMALQIFPEVIISFTMFPAFRDTFTICCLLPISPSQSAYSQTRHVWRPQRKMAKKPLASSVIIENGAIPAITEICLFVCLNKIKQKI